MTAFRYEAVDTAGRTHRGALDASSLVEARRALRQRAWLPTRLTEIPARQARRAPALRAAIAGARPALSRRVLSQVTRQLATLTANGIRFEDALQIVTRQGLPPRAAAILTQARQMILDGHSLTEALSAQGDAFPRHYIASIEAGEAAGQLGTVLAALADFTEAETSQQQSVRLAFLYPGLLALISGAVIVVLLTQVVPDVVAVYQRRGADLPFATSLLIAVSDGLIAFGAPLLAALLTAAGLARWQAGTPKGRLLWGRVALQVPVLGRFQRPRPAAQIAATLAMLIGSGVPFVAALRVAANVIDNAFVRTRLLEAAREVGDGLQPDLALARSGILPPMLLAIIASAVRSGGLGAALARAALTEQKDLDAEIKALVALLEPAVLLVMGGIVLFIVMAILTPIVNLNSLTGV